MILYIYVINLILVLQVCIKYLFHNSRLPNQLAIILFDDSCIEHKIFN